MIAIYGAGSAIAAALIRLLPSDETIARPPRDGGVQIADRHVFLRGLMRPKTLLEQSPAEAAESFAVNALSIMRACDEIFAVQPAARVCVVGSQSGYAWSHDGAYAAAKAALHRYVESKRLKMPHQQLVCVAPTIIGDAGMTIRRTDSENVTCRALEHPKGRWLTADEVARMIHFLLYVDRGYTSGTVIRMHGGGGS